MEFLIKEIIGEYGFFSQYYSIGDTISTEALKKVGFSFVSDSAESIIKGMGMIAILEFVEED